MANNLKILIDVDEVVARMLPAWIARYNQDYKDDLDGENITEWDLTKVVKPECGVKIYEYLDIAAMYHTTPTRNPHWRARPIEGALDGVRELSLAGNTLTFVTCTRRVVAGVKGEWLRAHGFMEYASGYVECYDGDKSRIQGDLMIDDKPKNLDDTPCRFKILYEQPHNKDEKQYLSATWETIPRTIAMWSGLEASLHRKENKPIHAI